MRMTNPPEQAQRPKFLECLVTRQAHDLEGGLGAAWCRDFPDRTELSSAQPARQPIAGNGFIAFIVRAEHSDPHRRAQPRTPASLSRVSLRSIVRKVWLALYTAGRLGYFRLCGSEQYRLSRLAPRQDYYTFPCGIPAWCTRERLWVTILGGRGWSLRKPRSGGRGGSRGFRRLQPRPPMQVQCYLRSNQTGAGFHG